MSTTPPPDTLTAALAWHAAGASVVRVALDGTKRPVGGWKAALSVRATEDQLRSWFSSGYPGLGIVMGAVSGNLEMLEFEGTAVEAGMPQAFNEIASASGLGETWDAVKSGYCERTPSGGYHLIYRVTGGSVLGNTKLARGADKAVQMETRGEGGQSVVAPSHGPVHASGQPWSMLAGSPGAIATIEAEHRDALFDIARMLDQTPAKPEPAPVPAQRPPGGQQFTDGGIKPGDDFEARTDWADILGPHGWELVHTSGRTSYWRRPGKSIGVSATTGHDPARDRLFVFTSSTEFEQEKPYNKFGAYALLEHRGDHSAAAKELRRRGYGERPRHLRTVPPAPSAARAAEHATAGAMALKTQAPTSSWTEPTESRILLPVPMPPRTWDDLGNAQRVVDRYGTEVRWITDTEQWAVYEAGRWNLRGANTAMWTRVVSTVDHLADEADNYSEEPPDLSRIEKPTKADKRTERENFEIFAKQQRMRPKLAAAREILQAHPAVHCLMNDFDRHEMLLNVANGIIDLTTGQILPHDRSLCLMQQSPIRFDPAARAPQWMKFLASVMPDEERRAYLARVVGYTLTGSTREQVMFIHHGDGQNGKGVFIRVLMALLGDYAQTVPRSTLLAKQGEGIPNDVARMMGKRLLSTTETSAGKKLDDELVKQLTGQDTVSARYMRAEFFEFEPVGKIHLATNYLPHVGGGHGIARRLQDIGWDVTIPPESRVADLDKKIIATEAAGILNWAIGGCQDWQQQGLAVPEAVRVKTQEHLTSSSPLAMWMSEEVSEVATSVVETRLVYANYKLWSENSGMRPMSLRAFSLAMKEQGIAVGQDPRTRRSTITGLRLNGWNGS
ncbi:phage/plasmid primase, P4 family [Kitasatospora sp. NBC_00070]|uniref:phage/plasmid primase, P4 family n=1 Tax=Kitasatospora sp. NBC_00070 TaxID=2975962 RepID=UPI003243AB9E